MRRARELLILGTALAAFALPAGSAGADSSEELERARNPRRHRSAEVLLDMDDAVRMERTESGVFRIRKRYGFEYAHAFSVDRRPFRFSVQGPAMPRKRLGVSFELRF
jgi:hypothetical protein